jgi:ADP-L-glycero-D-manno-heptose 6-epimerase
MKILVTGHKGFIGSYLARAVKQAGYELFTYEYGEAYPTVSKLDWIMHLGAISDTTERNVNKVMAQNYDFSVQLYNEAKQFGVNFQYASSASVYGLSGTFNEDSPVDPRTPYAWSKYMFERYVHQHSSNSIVHGFRYFNVYGPDGEEHKGKQASPFMQFKKQAEEQGKIEVFENSEDYYRDFVPVSDIINTHLKFLKVKESSIWNVGTGCGTPKIGGVAVEFSNIASCNASSTYALRPMINNLNWGGTNQSTVNAPSQTITLTFS